MGVPSFVSWLTKKYPAMVSSTCPATVHGLYIDLNGLIHPCCHSEHDASVARRSEEEKLRRICHEIDVLVATARPRELVYIAIDGVAPQAKMNQQRARRYMSQATVVTGVEATSGQTIVEEIAREFTEDEMARANDDLDDVRQMLQGDLLYGATALHADDLVKRSADDYSVVSAKNDGENNPHINLAANDDSIFAALGSLVDESPDESVATEEFDSNCISPGTRFMSRVLAAVVSTVEERLASGNPLWERLCVVVSGANTPGEGEHKIIDFLRTQSSYPGFNGKGAHMIVGLDADLVFLALSLHIPHVFVLRNNDRNLYKTGGASKKQPQQMEARKRKSENIKGGSSGTQAARSCHIKGDTGKEKNKDDDKPISAPIGSIECSDTSDSDTSNCSYAVSEVVANTTYSYFNIDVVGSCIVSELHGLCQMKAFAPANEEAFSLEKLVSASGYHFFRHAGLPGGAIHQPLRGGEEEERGNQRRKNKDWRDFLPCASQANSKIIDDVIVLAMLVGNDFLPRIPSAFCREGALDNLLELYVSDVLPYGFLTKGYHEISLPQLRRLFEAYATIEAVKFRRFGLENNTMTLRETAEPLHSSVDDYWRKLYLESTGLAGHIEEACEKYVEGICFVWRYYSSSSAKCDWSWCYPFHYGPFALDVATYLRGCENRIPQRKLLETPPPDMLLQLLCILPPTSHALLPASLANVMLYPTDDMQETFPTTWHVDCCATSGKRYLATVLLPFANMEGLRALVEAARPNLSKEEIQLAQMSDYHLVLASPSAGFKPRGDISEVTASETAAFSSLLQREGLIYTRLRDSSPERGRPKTYSCTASIPWVTHNDLGLPLHGGRRRKRKSEVDSGLTLVNKGPSLGVYLIGCAATSLLTVAVLFPWTSLLLPLQVVAVNILAILLAFLLGIAVHDPIRGSGIRRNSIRTILVDWLCTECLCLNFAVNEKCFLCCAPFDALRCRAIFGVKSSDPPTYDPDHTPYIEEVRLGPQSRKRVGASTKAKRHFPALSLRNPQQMK